MCILLVSHEMIVMGNVIDYIDSFNITVTTLKKIFPQQSRQFDNIFYDMQSFAQAIRSESAFEKLNVSFSMAFSHFSHLFPLA